MGAGSGAATRSDHGAAAAGAAGRRQWPLADDHLPAPRTRPPGSGPEASCRGRTGARCRPLSRSVSPARPPNRTCDSHRIRLSTSSGRWSSAAPMPVLVHVLALAVFAQGTSEFMLSGLVPGIARDLSVSVAAAAGLTSAYAIGMIVGALFIALVCALIAVALAVWYPRGWTANERYLLLCATGADSLRRLAVKKIELAGHRTQPTREKLEPLSIPDSNGDGVCNSGDVRSTSRMSVPHSSTDNTRRGNSKADSRSKDKNTPPETRSRCQPKRLPQSVVQQQTRIHSPRARLTEAFASSLFYLLNI